MRADSEVIGAARRLYGRLGLHLEAMSRGDPAYYRALSNATAVAIQLSTLLQGEFEQERRLEEAGDDDFGPSAVADCSGKR